MASLNVSPPRKLTEASAGTARDFDASDAASIIQHVTAARAVLRTVVLAVSAQNDGSIQFEHNTTDRWQPALAVACVKLVAVREVLTETRNAPPIDCFTSLTLVEAVDAALWHGSAGVHGDPLDDVELEIVARVAIESLDALMRDCEREGVFNMGDVKVAADLH